MIVVWRVTEACNLACPFCAYDRRLDRPRRHADPDSIRRFGGVLADYQRLTGDRVLVSWLGGEPLLWPPLTALSEHFAATLGLRVSTTTNGTTLADPAVRAHLLACHSELTISVDALGNDHDALRGWSGGFAQLRRSVGALARERDATSGLRLRANVVLTRDTIAAFGELCHDLAEWGSTRSRSIKSVVATDRTRGRRCGCDPSRSRSWPWLCRACEANWPVAVWCCAATPHICGACMPARATWRSRLRTARPASTSCSSRRRVWSRLVASPAASSAFLLRTSTRSRRCSRCRWHGSRRNAADSGPALIVTARRCSASSIPMRPRRIRRR